MKREGSLETRHSLSGGRRVETGIFFIFIWPPGARSPIVTSWILFRVNYKILKND